MLISIIDMKSCNPALSSESGVTIVEVLVAALLIFLALGSTLAMNTRSIHVLRSTRQAVASSQMLQQRIEAIRNKPWPEISNATALAKLMRVPTDSESELADNACTEFISISVPDALGGEAAGARAFSLMRQRGIVTVTEDGQDVHKPQQRLLRTILCRSGLTRSGLFGSTLGRPPAPATTLAGP